jgi:hypothetical protein
MDGVAAREQRWVRALLPCEAGILVTSKKARRRAAAASRLAASVQLFYPEHVGEFLCPTCLSWVPLSDTSNLLEAHVVPEAGGGRVTTVLCRRRCNSRFGERRDKWLGEYLRLIRHETPSFLHAPTQRGYFNVGNVRVAGKYAISSTGGLEFRIFADHTSPAALEQLPHQIHETITRALFPPGPIYEHTRAVNLTIPAPPLADHEDDVTLG